MTSKILLLDLPRHGFYTTFIETHSFNKISLAVTDNGLDTWWGIADLSQDGRFACVCLSMTRIRNWEHSSRICSAVRTTLERSVTPPACSIVSLDVAMEYAIRWVDDVCRCWNVECDSGDRWTRTRRDQLGAHRGSATIGRFQSSIQHALMHWILSINLWIVS